MMSNPSNTDPTTFEKELQRQMDAFGLAMFDAYEAGSKRESNRIIDTVGSRVFAAITAAHSQAIAEAVEAAEQLPHSTAKDNSLEIWSWKTPSGRKWNIGYRGGRGHIDHLITADTLNEAIQQELAQLRKEPNNG